MSGVLHVVEQVGPSLTQALAWFVVQGLLIGVLALTTAWLLRRRSANSRYLVHVSAMLLMLVCLPVNLLVLPTPNVSPGPDAVSEINSTDQPAGEPETLVDPAVIDNEAVGYGSDASDIDSAPMLPDTGEAYWPEGTEPGEPTAGIDDDGPSAVADWNNPSAWVPSPFDMVPDGQPVSAGENAVFPVAFDPQPTLWQQLSPWVVGIYLAGLVVFFLRLLAALRGGQQLRRAALAPDRKGLAWTIFEQQAQRLGIASKRVPGLGLLPAHFNAAGPLLIGLIKPMVLLPAAAITQLTPAQLEAVLAHELAHLKRYDPWVLLLQRVIETLLFFHPMMWMISSRVSAERENACDDMVLASGAKPADYASALVMFLPVTRGAEASASMTPATAAAAVSSSRSLRQRILRLFGEPTSTPVRLTRKGLVACAVMMLMSAVLVVLACQSVGTRHSGADPVEQNEDVSEQAVAESVAGEDRLYWSMLPVADGQLLRLDGPAGDAWSLMSDDPEGLFDKHTVSAAVLNESDWHVLSPEELIAIVDTTTNDQQPSHIAQLFSDESIAPTPGLPGEQVYQTRVIGYRTSNGTYGMVRVEEHLHTKIERNGQATFFGAGLPPRYAQVKRIVEVPDRFDIAWDQSIPALDMRADDPELEFLGDNLMQRVYDSRFAAEAGATYVLTARSAVGISALEIFLDDGTIHGGPIKVLARGHDRWHEYNRAQGVTEPNRDRCIRLVWTAPEDGTYTARVRFDDRDPDRRPKLPSTGGYTLDVRCLTTRPKISTREADSVPYDVGAIQRIELVGSAVLHKNSPPRLGLYYLPDTPEASFRLFDLLVVSGFDLNQIPYHRFDVLRRNTESGETKRLIDVPVFFGWQLGRDVKQASEPTALQPGDKVIIRPRDLFKGEEAKNLDREALGWGLPVNGLMCRWKEPEIEIHPGQETVPLTVQVRNVSDQPIVWETHWQLGRLSRDDIRLKLLGARHTDNPDEAYQGTTYLIVGGSRVVGEGIRFGYLRGGRMADRDEVSEALNIGMRAHAGETLPKLWPGKHYLPPGAVVELAFDCPLDVLADIGRSPAGGELGMPAELFAEVPRYDPYTNIARSQEEGSMTGPSLAVRVLPGEVDTRSGLGPVIERDMSRREQYLDLDTGEHISPAALSDTAQWGMWMIGPKGHPDGRVNLFHNPLSSNSENLSGRHVEFIPLDGMAFDDVTARDIEACWDEDGFVVAGKEARGGIRGITTRDGPHAFRTLAGKRGVVELVRAENEGRRWTVRLRHLPGKQPFTQPGEPTEGVSLHLHGVRYRDTKRVAQADGTTRPGIIFSLRARHDGSRKLQLLENHRRYQLCIDGTWYAYVLPKERMQDPAFHTGGKFLAFDPMAIPKPYSQPIIRELDNGYWYAVPQGEEEQEAKRQWGGSVNPRLNKGYGKPLVLSPGEHTVHIAITFGPAKAIEGHSAVRVVSNPMTIRVPGDLGMVRQDANAGAVEQVPAAVDWAEQFNNVDDLPADEAMARVVAMLNDRIQRFDQYSAEFKWDTLTKDRETGKTLFESDGRRTMIRQGEATWFRRQEDPASERRITYEIAWDGHWYRAVRWQEGSLSGPWGSIRDKPPLQRGGPSFEKPMPYMDLLTGRKAPSAFTVRGRGEMVVLDLSLLQWIDFLKQQDVAWSVSSAEDERFPDAKLIEIQATLPYIEYTDRYLFDLTRGGMLCFWEQFIARDDARKTGGFMHVLTTRRIDGRWVPSEVRHGVYAYSNPPDMPPIQVTTFNLVSYQAGPVDEAEMKVAFPVGATVRDHVNKAYYKVMAGHELKPLLDVGGVRSEITQEAIDAFHGVVPEDAEALPAEEDDAEEQAGKAEPVHYSVAMEALYEGVDRREAARLFREVHANLMQTVQRPDGNLPEGLAPEGVDVLGLAEMLDAMAKDDAQWQEPADLAALTQEQLIAYHLYHLRDVAGQPIFVPGKVLVLAPFGNTPGSNDSAIALREMGKAAVPPLIGLLDSDRPTRAISTGLNGNHVLRYSDVAVQLLSAIAGKRFMPKAGRGVYFANAPEDTRQQVVQDIERWWAANRERTEADWLRDAIAEDGVGRNVLGDDRAARLIVLQGLACADFFRERVAAEPENGNAVAVFWQAVTSGGGLPGPAAEDVLDEIRTAMASEHPGPRIAAYRILLKHGTDTDRKQIIPRLVEEIDAIAKLEDWSWRGVGFDFNPDELIGLMCREAQPASLEQAVQLLAHQDPRVVAEALSVLMRFYSPEAGPALNERGLAHVADAVIAAIRKAPAQGDGPLYLSQRFDAALWLYRQYNLNHQGWNHRRVDWPPLNARKDDAAMQAFVDDVSAWFDERAELEAKGLKPEQRRPHDAGVTVTGRVLSKLGGLPAAGVRVTLLAPSDQSRRWAVTDANGRYVFDAVPSIGQTHLLQVGLHGPGLWTEDVSVYIKAPGERFGEDRIDADDLYAEHPNTVMGRVIDGQTGEGVANYGLRVRTSYGRSASLKTDHNGRYRIHSAAREIKVTCNGDNTRYYAPVPQDEADGSPTTQSFTLDAGQTITAAEFKLQSAPRYTMRFVMPDGSPAEGLEVYVSKMYRAVEPIQAGFHMSMRTIGNEDRVVADKDGQIVGHLCSLHGQHQEAEIEITVIARTKDLQHGFTTRFKTTTDDLPPTDKTYTLVRCGTAEFGAVGPEGEVVVPGSVASGAEYRGHNHGSMGIKAIQLRYTEVEGGRYRAEGLIPGWEYELWASAEGYRVDRRPRVMIKPGEHKVVGDVLMKWWGTRAVPGLIEKLLHFDEDERASACRDLGAIGLDAVDAVDALIERMREDPESRVRYSAAEALGKIGPRAKPAVPQLIQALAGDEDYLPHAAAVALGLIGDEAAIPGLIQTTTHEDRRTRHAAIASLGELGGNDAIDGLSEVLRTHEVSDTRRAAVHALAEIGLRDTLPVLREAAKQDKSGPVREAAGTAVKKIEFTTRALIGTLHAD